MSQLPALPQEVIENIIDSVAAQPFVPNLSLWNCALTSRAFRIRSQFHIHNFVPIPNSFDESRIVQHYRRGSTLATYVRKIYLGGGSFDGDTFLQSRWRPILDLFPKLEVVDLNDLNHKLPLSPETFSPQYTTVTSLVLWQIHIPTCHTILSLLATLPNLSNLSLRSQWHCGGSFAATLPRIRELEIWCTEGLTGIECLNTHFDFSDLKVLRLYWHADRELRQIKMDSEPVLHLLREASSSLTTAYFGVRFFPPFRVVPGHTNLSHNTSLEILTIGVVFLVWEPLGVPDFGWLPDLLGDVSSGRFRQLKIQVRIENTIQFSYVPWGRIDAILSGSRFPTFQQLTIELSNRSSMPWRGLEYEGELSVEQVLPVAVRLLPNLAARNSLNVVEPSSEMSG